jgi:hypothetical protein
VSAFSQVEHWARDNAKAPGITAETKRALAQLFTWARGLAGENRQVGRLEVVEA